jgi:hypothetical protein
MLFLKQLRSTRRSTLPNRIGQPQQISPTPTNREIDPLATIFALLPYML